jgi:hypothetical protein
VALSALGARRQLGEALFGPSSKGRAWAKQMRKYLKTTSIQ